MGILNKIIGTHSEREVKRVLPIIDQIDAKEPEISALSDEELKAKTQEFKDRLEKAKHWMTYL